MSDMSEGRRTGRGVRGEAAAGHAAGTKHVIFYSAYSTVYGIPGVNRNLCPKISTTIRYSVDCSVRL